MNPFHYLDIVRVLCLDEFMTSARDYESMPRIERVFGRDIFWGKEDLVSREKPIPVPRFESYRRR